MERMRIAALFADAEALGGKEITVMGWVKSVRDMEEIAFVTLNDGSCFRSLQVVLDSKTLSNYRDIASQNVGASLIVRGTVELTPEAKQPLELKAAAVEVEGASDPTFPVQKKGLSREYLRTIQHLRPRTNLFSAVFRVRSAAAYAVHEFFQSRGFVYVNTPIITGSDAEGAGEMFQVTTMPMDQVPMTEDGAVDYSQDFFRKPTHRGREDRLHEGLFRQKDQPDRFRPAQRRKLRHGLWRRVHLRPNLPRRELQHAAPRRRVLDDRAGDGVLRLERRP